MILRAVILLGVGVAIAWTTAGLTQSGSEPKPGPAPRAAGQVGAAATGMAGTTTINAPRAMPRVRVSVPRSASGEVEVDASCTTCHATRTPNATTASGAELDEFHGGMMFAHGNNRCLACHDATDYDAFHLADGARVEMADVMTLCAQCHAAKVEEFAHGAHGGMNGFWDLSRGSRTRNHCLDCHDPHAPAFPRMVPTFKPKDRFLTRKGEHAEDSR
ncbi:MAG: hypothetical protein IPH13_08570 [Planctomycetes bacterium]|nr:hypothetical protein [Planctomycetota bacterium]MCC7172398.1 hypothetical protein [Planctomycetota bacterium]